VTFTLKCEWNYRQRRTTGEPSPSLKRTDLCSDNCRVPYVEERRALAEKWHGLRMSYVLAMGVSHRYYASMKLECVCVYHTKLLMWAI
jgi:hypothetical protein